MMRWRRRDGRVGEADSRVVSMAGLRDAVMWRRFRWRRGQKHHPGWYWSVTTQAHVGYESRLELARLMLLDFDPAVVWVSSQPFLIEGRDGSRTRRHVPDYLVEHVDESVVVVDVKPAQMLARPEVAEALAWSQDVVEARGWGYRIETEPDATLLGNVAFLSGYRRGWQFPGDQVERALGRLSGPLPISHAQREAAAVTGDEDSGRAIVLHLLWRRLLVADLSRPLQSTTLVAAAA